MSYERNLIAFVDAGFLRAEGAKIIGTKGADVRPNASAVVDWLRKLASSYTPPLNLGIQERPAGGGGKWRVATRSTNP